MSVHFDSDAVEKCSSSRECLTVHGREYEEGEGVLMSSWVCRVLLVEPLRSGPCRLLRRGTRGASMGTGFGAPGWCPPGWELRNNKIEWPRQSEVSICNPEGTTTEGSFGI